jgi:hypothetical protein
MSKEVTHRMEIHENSSDWAVHQTFVRLRTVFTIPRNCPQSTDKRSYRTDHQDMHHGNQEIMSNG